MTVGLHVRNRRRMNNDLNNMAETHDDDDDMLPEYDFSTKTGVRGTYYQAMRQGYTIKVTKEDGTTVIQQITRLFRRHL